MCGICGYFNFSGIEKDKDKILKMTFSLLHRGPDDNGVYIDDYCALGHTRLSIIDLEGGHQPMSDDEEKIIIVFNGEIYNFLELKENLLKLGYNFKTRSDTEVIIYAYKHWGEDFVNKLNGMFAIAIYDRFNRKLLLYRDRIGLKPLFYTILNDTIIFASEPKAIFMYSDNISKKLNLKALSMYLSSHNINFFENTLFENIKLLQPAQRIIFQNKLISKDKYWDISFNEKEFDFEILKKEVKENLRKATLMRLIADVPVGAYLSGGVDSTVLISIIAEKFKKNLKTFTIGINREGYNEFYFSEIVNNQFKTDNEKVLFPEDDYFDLLTEYISIKDFPLNVPNEILIYYLSLHLRKYIKVVISGEGSDEIFGGYGLFLRSAHDFIKIFMLKNCPDFFPEEIMDFMRLNLEKYYKKLDFKDFPNFIYNVYSVFKLQEKKFLLNDDLIKEIDKDKEIIDEFSKILNINEELNLYDRLFYFLETFHLPGLLLRLDNATMSASVEARAPFTDFNLVNYSFRIPVQFKLKWKGEKYQNSAIIENAQKISEKFDITKYILKETFKHVIPEQIYKRDKWSFPVPLNYFFNEKFKTYIFQEFKRKSIFYEFFNFKNVNLFVNEVHFKDKGLKTWMLLNLKLWMEKFL